MSPIRIGRISSINYEKGMAQVVYADRDNSVTTEIPFLSFEYNMPQIGSQVLVVHISSGEELGVIIGNTWSQKNKPYNPKKGVYRKEYADEPDKAVITYDNETGILMIKAPHLTCVNQAGEEVEVIPKIKLHDEEITALKEEDEKQSKADADHERRITELEALVAALGVEKLC